MTGDGIQPYVVCQIRYNFVRLQRRLTTGSREGTMLTDDLETAAVRPGSFRAGITDPCRFLE